MSNTLKISVSFIVILLMAFGLFQIGDKTSTTKGSVVIGNEYHSTTTTAAWNASWLKMADSCTNSLGSVIVTKATAGSQLTLMDATSTTDVSSTTITVISSTATSNTYQYDAVLLRGGLGIIATSGNVSSTTITCR